MRSCLCSVVNWTVQWGKETRKSCFLLCGEEQMKWLPPYLVHDFSTCNKRGHDPPKTVLRSKKMWQIAMNCGELRWMRQIAANCRELRRIGILCLENFSAPQMNCGELRWMRQICNSLLRKIFSAAKLQQFSDGLRQIAANWGGLRRFAVICSKSSIICSTQKNWKNPNV